ncbi:MAG: tetratricopeptide repeat protein [Treponema sp.]|nr:tetratricopeptide repeat protein [Treponema sp.]
MAENTEKQTASSKLNSFIESKKKIFITCLIILLCAIVGYIIAAVVINNAKVANLTALDDISYTLTESSASLEESELTARRIDAVEKLEAYTSKGGIVGARANMLKADLLYQQKNYAESAEAWKATASKAAKTYIEPIAYYNLAVCNEELGQNEEAIANYKLAADNKDFILKTHAAFSYGRALESAGKYAEAFTAYSDLYGSNPDDSWAKLAKTRMLTLQIEGKAE